MLALACTTSQPQPEPAAKTGEAKAAPTKTDKAAANSKDQAGKADKKAKNAKRDTKRPPNPHRPRQRKQVPPPDDVAAPPEDAIKTESGLAYKILEQGEGEGEDKPGPNDRVKVDFTGWTTDGETYDTTQERAPRTYGVSKVTPGWTEALQLMTVGTKIRMWLPEELAFKRRPHQPKGMLVYDMELLEIIKAPDVPENVAAAPADAKKTDSGLAYKVLTKGKGSETPDPWDRVEVHYSGWTTDGNMFDSSVLRGRTAKFALTRVIPGWTEGVALMKKGEKTRFWIPEELAYKGAPRKPQGMLVFDIELVDWKDQEKPPPPPEVPDDVAAAPEDAKTTESGLAYKVLKPGKGGEHPTATSRVTVHYSGWTTDGKMFDSSVTRNKPSTFGLNRVIKGWTEGVQLMTEGEKTRFWIPAELAYGNQPGKPQGMLVFDIELIEIAK